MPDYVKREYLEGLLAAREKGSPVSGELAQCFALIAFNLFRAFKMDRVEQDEAIQEGVLICILKVDRYEIGRAPAFNFFTTCILNQWRQLYRKIQTIDANNLEFWERKRLR